ncbi:hypothetical protein [Microcoleus sp. LEGE 07076]|jgi:hypothetical protein|uniref:hypothetical protein n=1 Tax=Microcoleus sp. LEGE 07076 TaxID=915322 RepID=UPI0030D78B79
MASKEKRTQPVTVAGEVKMTYFERLHPWCIIKLLPNCQRIVVARFRRRRDADDHFRVLQRFVKESTFVIVFDIPPKPTLPKK